MTNFDKRLSCCLPSCFNTLLKLIDIRVNLMKLSFLTLEFMWYVIPKNQVSDLHTWKYGRLYTVASTLVVTLDRLSAIIDCQPSYRLKLYGFRAFSVCAPSLWNKLPTDIKCSPTVVTFKCKLKTYLFRLDYY